MNLNICNNCGGEYEYRNGCYICRACGALKPEEISNEEVTLLYTAYQKLRLADFDEAEKEFDDIVLKYPKNPNGYWGRLMAKYGIKYEQDYDGRMIPTCYATSIEGLYFSADYKKALEYADENTRAYYREQAGYIERVRREWIEKAVREKPYDIFLCYKDSDLANGIERTEDSLAVQELYIHLTSKGYRVFYSHESLRDKVGEKYEPYIFRALSTAKVMLVYGSKPEYITSTWLKNEWTRYDKRIKAGEKKPESLLVACDGFSPSELPNMLSSRQCFNARDRSFYSDLDEMIEKIIFNKTGGPMGTYPFEAKKKSKAPFYITMLLLLALAAGIYAFPLLKEETVQTVTNSSYQSTIYMNDGQFPKGTEFRMKEVLGDTYFLSMASSLAVNKNNWHFYDMELWYDGEEYDPEGNVTVTLPIPAGMSEENVVVYYMSGSRPQKISANASGGKVTFITNHFSVYMVAEETMTCSHEILIDPAIEATCTREGLTEGKHCSLCGEVFVAQEVVPATGHTAGKWETVTVATATANGLRVRKCAICGETLQEEIIPATGSGEGQGLTFISNGDGTCTLTSNGTCTDVHLVIPSEYNGDRVTGIRAGAFRDYTHIKSVVIPDSVTSIGAGAFSGCSGLQEITIPFVGGIADATEASEFTLFGYIFGTENYIGGTQITQRRDPYGAYYYFYIPTTLKTVTLTGGSLLYGSFYGCSTLTDISLPDDITAIAPYSFRNCGGLTSMVIPDAVMAIGEGAFRDCAILTKITIPDGVTSIGNYAFSGCTALRDVYYMGTSVEWGSISIGSDNDKLTSATIHYNSDSEHVHVYDSVETKEPTCTTQGYTTYTCACGDTYTDNYVSALGHTAGEWETVTEATESEAGLKVQNCTACGETVNEEIIPATGGNESVNASQGLEFTSNGDGTCYVSGIGTCTDTDIVIPSEYNGMKVTGIGTKAFYDCDSLTSIEIPSSVTSIGYVAFYCCYGLTSVTIGSGVTSIGQGAFYNCSGLTSVTIPSGVTSIGSSAFSVCYGLTSVTIPDGVTSIGFYAFSGCLGLTSIEIPDSVTSIGEAAFADCYRLTSIVVEDSNEFYCSIDGVLFDKSVTTIMCYPAGKQGENYTIPDGVTSIGGSAFRSCSGLTSITIPDGVTSIGSFAFSDCSGLTSVTISSGVTSIGERAFYNCSGLTSVTIPDSVTSIGTYAFRGCSGLTDVYYTGVESDWANISIGSNNDPLTSATIHYNYVAEFPDTNEFIFTSNGDGTCTLIGVGTNTASDLIIPSEYNGMAVTAIGERAFFNCNTLESVVIPDSVMTIHTYAFASCRNLMSVTLGLGVTEIQDQAFAGCPRLIEVINFSSLELALGGESNGRIAFFAKEVHYGESRLFEIDDFVFYPYQDIYYLVNYKGSEVDVILPEDCNGSTYMINNYAFYNRSDMISVVIPDSVTTIEMGAFSGCSGLVSMTLPIVEVDLNISLNATILSNMSFLFAGIFGISGFEGAIPVSPFSNSSLSSQVSFYVPSSLKEVTLTSGSTINASAFAGCTNLTSVTIPNSVTSIKGRNILMFNYGAFANCESLTEIHYDGTIEQWHSISLGSGWDTSSGEYTIYCLNGTITKAGEATKTPSEGLAFASNGDGTCTLLSIGTCADTYLVIPSQYNGMTVTAIGANAFKDCINLTGIEIPDSVTTIGAGAFSGCSGLISMTIPFVGGSASATSASASTLFGYIFGRTSYEGGVSTTQNFAASNSDTTYSATYYIPSGLKTVTVTRGKILYGAFYNCSNLKNVVLPEDITTISTYAFYNCGGLTSITIPESVTSIGLHAFRNCSSLTNITIPSGVTSIGSATFFGCSSLTSIVIPDTVTTITGKLLGLVPGAFDSCTNLTEIHYSGTIEQWQSISLGSGWDTSSGEYTIYCADGEISKDGIITMY